MTNTPKLSELERSVLRFIAEGLSYEAIGSLLETTPLSARQAMHRVRRRLGADTNAQAVLIAAWHHAALLAGCVAAHGTPKALDWHDDHGIPQCGPCREFSGEQEAPKAPRAPRAPKRQLIPKEQHLKRGAPAKHGTMQMARRHIRARERISDLTCGCREAYQEWYREYQRGLRASA